MPIAARIARQFGIVWDTIDETIALVPDDEWVAGEEGAEIPVVQLAHVAAAIALYLPPPGRHWPAWCESASGNFYWEVGAGPWPSGRHRHAIPCPRAEHVCGRIPAALWRTCPCDSN